MERLATYSAPLIVVGDFNIHVDDATNDDTIKLCDVLSTHDLQQHVSSSTHRQGHMLDLFITRSDQLVDMLPIDPPLLSDHSFIIADLDCTPLCRAAVSYRAVRNWRALDVNAFSDDLRRSELVTALPESNVDAALSATT